MSNKFDDYHENDEISLTSSDNLKGKIELKRENERLKRELEDCYNKIHEYEEIISKTNIKDIGNNNNDTLFNISHNSNFMI